jgi:hypothetical protein
MISRRVDAAWHLFVLFTREYGRFCDEHFGRYLHHRPKESPPLPGDRTEPAPLEARRAFVEAYERHFGPLPAEWDDAAGVKAASRLAVEAPLVARAEQDRAELARVDGPTLPRVDGWALPALAFVAEHLVFLVRELPGIPHPDDRVALGRALITARACHLAV